MNYLILCYNGQYCLRIQSLEEKWENSHYFRMQLYA